MARLALVILAVLICGVVYAETIEIPDSITKEQASEWMSILVERKVNAAINANPVIVAATEAAKVEIDTYRSSVGLPLKFKKEDTVASIQE